MAPHFLAQRTVFCKSARTLCVVIFLLSFVQAPAFAQYKNSDAILPKKKLNLRLSKKEWLEAAVGQGAALADELTTERILHSRGGYEADPLARPFTKLPEPAYIASGAAMTAGLTWLAHKLKKSHNKFLHGVGDVAQDIQIGANTANAIRNSQLPVKTSPSQYVLPKRKRTL